jgi:MFS family permease
MTRGFISILAAQFFSSLADNALLFAAIAMMKTLDAPAWETPLLQQSFVFSAIALAPFVGAFADALPKGRVMFVSNSLKTAGCLAMLLGLHPLLAYASVGVGAAMYSPAKYGILAEYFPPEKLVWANGWMEGLTVAAIILGAIAGGLLIGDGMQRWAAAHLSEAAFGSIIDSGPEFAVGVILGIYFLAALVNLYIPKLPKEHAPPPGGLWVLVQDFWVRFKQLWRDPLGQVSLAVSSLFWGAGTTLRLAILVWGATALGLSLEQATQMTAATAVGIGIGAAAAGKRVPLHHAVRVLKMGIYMGVAVMLMALVTDWRIALPMLLMIGAMSGYFLVPMNALLQHRGHRLMGSGHSIALQNFNENSSILLMLGAYALMLKFELSILTIVVVLGAFLAIATAWLAKLHGHDQDHGES